MKAINYFLFESTQKYIIYLDMDGVICDWDKAVEALGHGPAEEVIRKRGDGFFWAMLANEGETFWANIEWTPDGKELWNYLKKYKPTILSAPTKSPTSRTGKHLWVKKHLGPDVKLILEDAKDKHLHAKPNAILIDDRESNISDWKKAGGIGILHKSTIDTLGQLSKLLE